MKQKQIAIVVGHEPGGGAAGERSYNLALAVMMRDSLEDDGFEVYIHKHHTSSYSRRQDEMREKVKQITPDAECCIELHYNAYSNPLAQGHEFLYRGSKRLAECFRDEFQEAFPWSVGRRDDGIGQQMTGNGAGFLRKSPAWAVLVEPFFSTNPDESRFFMANQVKLADCYCRAIKRFCE